MCPDEFGRPRRQFKHPEKYFQNFSKSVGFGRSEHFDEKWGVNGLNGFWFGKKIKKENLN